MTDSCYVGTAICEHSQIQESCWYCKVNGQLQALNDLYKSIIIQCAANHEHKLRQIDENRKISKKVDELQKNADINLSLWSAIDDRIEELENPDNEQPDHVLKMHERIDYVLVRLSKLEKFHDEFKDVLRKDLIAHRKMWDEVYERLDRLEQSSEARARSNKEIFERLQEIERFQDITHLEYQNRNKKPHKCPICDGSTYRSEMTFHHCNVCEGKGIVWC